MPSKNQTITDPSFFIGVDEPDVISFGSGQPDLPPPAQVFQQLDSKRLFKYGLVRGEEKLRQALSQEYQGASSDDFVVTNGASEALDLVFRALYQLHGSVQVLVCRPYYYSYPPIIEFAGHTPVFTDLVDGCIDIDDFKAKLGQVKVILINSPSNPTGRVEDVKTLREIEKLAAQSGAYVISDEVYKDLIYERENYQLHGDHIITINSFSKSYSMCGLRIGYLFSKDKDIVNGVIAIKMHTSMNTNILAQEMALEATRVPRSFVEQQATIWQKRRDTIYEGLRELDFELWKPEGAFYVLPKIQNSAQVVTDLFYDHGVIVYDGAWFGAPGRIRLSYALDLPKIEVGLSRIAQYLEGKQEWLK